MKISLKKSNNIMFIVEFDKTQFGMIKRNLNKGMVKLNKHKLRKIIKVGGEVVDLSNEWCIEPKG